MDKELIRQYEKFEFYPLSEMERNHTQKIVKIKAKRKCVNCQKTINKGDFTLREKAVYDGEWATAYTCINCCREIIGKEQV